MYTTKELYKAWLLVDFEHVFLDLLVSMYNRILQNNVMCISGGHNSKQSSRSLSLLPSSCGNTVKVGSSFKPLKIVGFKCLWCKNEGCFFKAGQEFCLCTVRKFLHYGVTASEINYILHFWCKSHYN